MVTKVDPFRIPRNWIRAWEEDEITDQLRLFPKEKTITKGKRTRVTVESSGRYPEGTVNKFRQWYGEILSKQVEEQKFWERFSKKIEEMGLTDAKSKGKKLFSMDKSHFVPRRDGGSGFTFLEGWYANQKRGAAPIMSDSALVEAGIPRNWQELFEYWLYDKETLLGPLEDINIDDFFSVERGEQLNTIIGRRRIINNLINRAKGNPADIDILQNDFEILIRESKGLDIDDDIYGFEKAFSLGHQAGYEKIGNKWIPKDTEADARLEQIISDQAEESTKFFK